jgi:hypothetical protein
LVWFSWQFWPLTKVHPPQAGDWKPPAEPTVAEIEVGAAAFLAAFATAVLTLGLEQNPAIGLVAGLALAPIGFFIGRQARQFWKLKQEEKYADPAVPSA